MSWIDRVNRLIEALKFVEPSGTIDLKPSQKDKPSPHAGLSMSELRRRLITAFPYSEGYKISYVANTNSMEPLIDDNSIAVQERLDVPKWRVKFLKKAGFKKGDIVVYSWRGIRFIHMLQLYQRGRGWLVQGVNNKVPDPFYVPEKAILSRVVCIGYSVQKRRRD